MTFEEMQGAWKSAENGRATEAQRATAASLVRQMVRRRRWERYWLTQALVLSTLLTGVSGWAVASGRTSLAQEWALLAVVGLPWGCAVVLLRRFLKDRSGGLAGERPVAATLFRLAVAVGEMMRSTRSEVHRAGLRAVLASPQPPG